MLFIVAILAAVVAFFVHKNAKKRFNKAEITFSLLGIFVAIAVACFTNVYCYTCRSFGSYRFFWFSK